MRLVSVRQEAHYRGYRIEGLKQGEGLLLRVIPTRPGLPVLKYSRFRTLRAPWVKAVGVVVGYIDEMLREAVHDCSADECGGRLPEARTYELTGTATQVEELLKLNALLRLKLSQLEAKLSSASKPTVNSGDERPAPGVSRDGTIQHVTRKKTTNGSVPTKHSLAQRPRGRLDAVK